MKKILAFVLSLCCLLCLWTSCGKDNDKEQASSTSTADTTELLSQTTTSDTSWTTTTEPEPEPEPRYGLIRVTERAATNNTGTITFDYKIVK